jgi:aarF domain-containing kinase
MMKGFNFTMAVAFARTDPRGATTRGMRTCRQCLLQSRGSRIGDQVRGYARRSNAHGNGGFKSARSKKGGRVLVAAAGGALGVTAVAFTDDVRHAYEAAERTGRVVSTLAVCINE